MGLDWLVDSKVIDGKETDHSDIAKSIELLNRDIDIDFDKYLSDRGLDIPSVWPNEVQAKFLALPEVKKKVSNLEAYQKKLRSLEIHPLQTLKAPQVGLSAEATLFATEYWEKNLKDKVSLEVYLRDNQGQYIPNLVDSPGLPSVGGIFVGAESFRGKMLGFVEWLDDCLKNEAYTEHGPEALVDYGNRLQAAVTDVAGDGDMPGSDTVAEAASWCVFWGSHGHTMRPWY